MGHTVNINKQRIAMTVTLQASYKEFLQAETVELIDNLIEDNYELSDMLEFIDENSEDDFVAYYEEYCEQGEKLGYNVVDAFIHENGLADVENCEEAYVGTYRDVEEFVEDLMENTGDDRHIPSYVVIDFKATWEQGLSDDYDAVDIGGGVHFFRRYF